MRVNVQIDSDTDSDTDPENSRWISRESTRFLDPMLLLGIGVGIAIGIDFLNKIW